jgi:RHS repeat-associated protein
MIYENGVLKRILTSVGYWEAGTYYYFLKDHLGSNRVVMTGSGCIAETSSYYPSGMRFGESAVNGGSVQPYRHTGHEMQEMHGLNWIDNLARFRTVSDGGGLPTIDPLCEKYYSISPYSYCGGNPMNNIDVNGDSTFLVTWATANGSVGHAALAVSNYKTEVVKDSNGNVVLDSNGNPTTKQVEDGTYTVYQLGPAPPGVGLSNFDEDVTPDYTVMKNVTRDQLFNSDVSNCGEKRAADGIIGIGTNYAMDKKVNYRMNFLKGYNKDYNGVSNNCSDYVQAGVETASGIRINANERVSFLLSSHIITTPNQLFKSTRTLKNSLILKNPGKLINNTFYDGYKQ